MGTGDRGQGTGGMQVEKVREEDVEHAGKDMTAAT